MNLSKINSIEENFNLRNEIQKFRDNKTFKFSDAFTVEMIDRDSLGDLKGFIDEACSVGFAGKYIETMPKTDSFDKYRIQLYNCSQVSIPYYHKTRETINFSNFDRETLMPNLDAPDPLSLTFTEDSTLFTHRLLEYIVTKTVQVFSKVNDSVVGNEKPFRYRPYAFVDEIQVKIYGNDMTEDSVIITHSFENCRVSDYNFNYALGGSETIINPTLDLSYLTHTIKIGEYLITNENEG